MGDALPSVAANRQVCPTFWESYFRKGSLRIGKTLLAGRGRRDYEQAVILNVSLGSLAGLSLVLLLWQWLAARRFPLHRRSADLPIRLEEIVASPNAPARRAALLPAVTLLKPIKGCDAHTEDCLRSWFTQDYTGEVQLLLGVAAADDPACQIIRQLIGEFPKQNAQLFVCGPLLGANAKVSKLAQLVKLAKHEVLVISDADVRVPADFLVNAVLSLSPQKAADSDPGKDALHRAPWSTGIVRDAVERAPTNQTVGLVSCFYRLANPTTLAMHWEAVAINADFWSQVLQSKSLQPLDFALGAVMVTRKKNLAEIGGFESLADCLADDYQLGHRIAKCGHRIELCPVVVECWHSPQTWREVWKHQLRWARTIRVCQPGPYFFSIVSNVTFWALLWFAIQPTLDRFEWMFLMIIYRVIGAGLLQKRLTSSIQGVEQWIWLVPLKDLLQAAVWLCAFTGNTIEWRGQRFHLRKDGTLVKLQP